MYFVLPAFRISSRAEIESSRGVSVTSELAGRHNIHRTSKHTRVNAMEVVKVRGETESLDCSLDVSLDVRCRVGDTSIAKNVKPAL